MGVKHTGVKISFFLTQFLELPFCGPRTNPHEVQVLIKHYHIQFYPKRVPGICSILQIPCACVTCNNMLDKTFPSGVLHTGNPDTSML